MVSIHAFISFLFFDFFMNLMISGTCLEFILDILGSIWLPIFEILGSWDDIEIFIKFATISSPSNSWVYFRIAPAAAVIFGDWSKGETLETILDHFWIFSVI